ncbi:MAG TPA: hypothetical protein DFS52_27225, partial [Myxococcales bacterium]|nr:hypothetical protein [Myxococcales bacterium]
MQQPSEALSKLAAGKRDRSLIELAALAGILVGYLLLSQLLASNPRRWPVFVFPGLWLFGASALWGWRRGELAPTGGRRALPWAGASLLACA